MFSFVSRNEINILHKKNAVLTSLAGLECSSTQIAAMLAVVTIVLTGQTLTPVNVAMLLSFINALRINISYLLAYGLLETYEAYVSLRRIECFLLLEDTPAISSDQTSEESTTNSMSAELNSKLTDHKERRGNASLGHEVNTDLSVSNLTCKQVNREDEYILENIDLTTESQSLTVITGPVGSGKSTLLSAIAGEVPNTSGTRTCKGTLAYVPQIAWVFSGTIRENILFGLPHDETKYTRVIEACALKHDLQQFPDGDQTVVGERGEVLSGGQQARVSLARTVYADADIYLLDDPLSAVDFKVGQHIFDKCIQNLLGNKTRVLISHQEQHMKEADGVVVLYKGRVLGKGRFIELQEKGVLNTTVDPLYQKALKDVKSEKDNDDQEKEFLDSNDRKVPLPSKVKGLEISEEDRTIGRVSSKLYWNYFRSGTNSLGIIALICLCLITQGKPLKARLHRRFLSQQLNAIFVALKLQLQNRTCKPLCDFGAIFAINRRGMRYNSRNTVTLSSSFTF